MAHGAGGEASARLVRDVFMRSFGGAVLGRMEDSARLQLALSAGEKLAMTTDSYVVTPIFFPGGDIGKLAICGTVNDLSMVGARPQYITCGFILEEGFSLDSLERLVASMSATAAEVGVEIVAGDTKVVGRGAADGVFINTAGMGIIPAGVEIAADAARPGDLVAVSGTVGEHGAAILAAREGFRLGEALVSDCAPLWDLVRSLIYAGVRPAVLRDPTRGGLAAVLNEIAAASGVAVRVREADVPLSEAVRGACEILGLDPWFLACEGRMVAFLRPEDGDLFLEICQAHPLGAGAAIIGRVEVERPGRVVLEGAYGQRRPLTMPAGEPLPRIC